MKYNNIATTLKWQEEPECSDGLFLQPEEAATIDTDLARISAAEATTQSATAELATANGTIETLNATISTMEATAGENATTISTQASRITELENRVTELGAEPSGKGTTLETKGDDKIEDTSADKGLRYDDPNHPANAAARARGIK